jgi:acetoin utilization protein AcuB
MNRVALPIENYMSSVLILIEPTQTIAEAARLMRQHEIRHLPVIKHGKVVGILSQRDVHLIETLEDVDPARVAVEEAMTEKPYVVDPEEPLHVVATEMAKRKIGSAVVAHGDKLQGLFTTTDALLALAALVFDADLASPEAEAPKRSPSKGSASNGSPSKSPSVNSSPATNAAPKHTPIKRTSAKKNAGAAKVRTRSAARNTDVANARNKTAAR